MSTLTLDHLTEPQRQALRGPLTGAEPTLDQRARAGILHNAAECESCLQLATAAEDPETGLSPGIATGLRKLAAMYAEQAFRWARHLAPAIDAEGGEP